MERRAALAAIAAFVVRLCCTAAAFSQQVPAQELRQAAALSSDDPAPVLPEVEQLRERLRVAEEEIAGLRNPKFPSGSFAQPGNAAGGDSGGTSGDLASKSQDPVSDLVSVPYQSNFDFGIAPENRMGFVGKLQPVVPFKLNDDWNLISRVILPMVNAPVGPDLRSDGLGDSVFQFYLSPRDAERFVWGIGPNVLLPTASDRTLGFQEWGVGVNGVVLMNQKPVVTGVLVSQTWSVQGNTKPFQVQPFFNYNLPKGWFLSVSGEFNADWELPKPRRYLFPLGAGIGRVFPILGQPVSISARFAPYLEAPPDGPDWQFRLSMAFLFPK